MRQASAMARRALPSALCLAVLTAGAAGERHSAEAAAAYSSSPFGSRDLQAGDRGADVKTLNWVLRAQGLSTLHHDRFDGLTHGAVKRLQSSAGLPGDGVVRRETRKAMASRMLRQRATWYGPGLYGDRTACGVKLRKRTIGVAHRKLPCGTRVAFAYKGRWHRAKVIDRGPFRRKVRWDLTKRLAKRLGATEAGWPVLRVGVAP